MGKGKAGSAGSASKKQSDASAEYHTPWSAEECLAEYPAGVDGKVDRHNLFAHIPDNSWWPTQYINEITMDVMGTEEQVWYALANDKYTICYAPDTCFCPPGDDPNNMKAMGYGHPIYVQMPDEKSLKGKVIKQFGLEQTYKSLVTSFRKATRIGAYHYVVTHQDAPYIGREHSHCTMGTQLIDFFTVGPAQNGRKDMSSLRYKATFIMKPYLSFLIGNFIGNLIGSNWAHEVTGYYEYLAAVHATLYPDANVPVPYLLMPTPSKKLFASNLFNALGMGLAYYWLTGLLSCVLLWLTGGAMSCLLGPCTLRVVPLLLLFAYIIKVEILDYKDKGVATTKWEECFNSFMIRAGMDDRDPGDEVTQVPKYRMHPIKYTERNGRPVEGPIVPRNKWPGVEDYRKWQKKNGKAE